LRFRRQAQDLLHAGERRRGAYFCIAEAARFRSGDRRHYAVNETEAVIAAEKPVPVSLRGYPKPKLKLLTHVFAQNEDAGDRACSILTPEYIPCNLIFVFLKAWVDLDFGQ
jgi:hypothetical protein